MSFLLHYQVQPDRPMNKSNLTVEDLLADSSFIEYCLTKNLAETNPWDLHLLKHPEDKITFLEAKKILLLLTAQIPEEIIDDKLNSFKKLFYQTNFSVNSSEEKKSPKKRRLFIATGIAASLLLITTSILFFFKTNQPSVTAFNEIKGQTIVTSPTDRNSITLSDGTVAVLYPGSKLTISDDYNKDDRKVAITGQVYLKIYKDKQRPFVAYSRHSTTTAIGTAFYVRDFERSKESSVLLVHGKVKVGTPGRHAAEFLEPGTSLIINNKTLKSEKRAIDNTELEELANRKLIFQNAVMESIVYKLELFYGVDIDLSTCKCEFKNITGDYSKQSLVSILNTISFINQVKWTIQDHRIVFTSPSE